jgi:hypothetical protein
MLAENALYEAGSELVEAAISIARDAADPAAAAAVPALLGCIETTLEELSRACTALRLATDARDARGERLRRGYANLGVALDEAADAGRAARGLAARCATP